MSLVTQSEPVSGAALWSGRVLSGLVILFLVFDAGLKLVAPAIVPQTMAELGWPATLEVARMLGVLTLACTVLYAHPRTSVLGAILLTAYLGGAVAAHVRIGNPLFSHILFGVYLGVMAWGGLFLRDRRLRALIPFKQTGQA